MKVHFAATCGVAWIALAAPALADDDSEFRIPAHRWSSVAFGFTASGAR